MKLRVPQYSLAAAVLLLALPICLHAGPPIVIGDGSVCVEDGQTDIAGGAAHHHERAFNLARIIVEKAKGQRECEPVLACPPGSKTCQSFDAPVKDLVVDFKEGNNRLLLMAIFENGIVRLTSVGTPFGDWTPAQNRNRQKRRPNASIQGIFIDGQPVECTRPCRITLVEPPTP